MRLKGLTDMWEETLHMHLKRDLPHRLYVVGLFSYEVYVVGLFSYEVYVVGLFSYVYVGFLLTYLPHRPRTRMCGYLPTHTSKKRSTTHPYEQCCIVLQCVAVCCSVLQKRDLPHRPTYPHIRVKRDQRHTHTNSAYSMLYNVLRPRWECCGTRGGGLGSSTIREVGGWGRVPFSRNLMSPTPRRKWYLTTGRRAH